MLNQLCDIAIRHADRTRVNDGESVERVAQLRGVNPCVKHREIEPGKHVHDARKQLRSILDIYHDLQAFAGGHQARAHHWGGGFHAEEKVPRMPGDFVRTVALQIDRIQRAPEFLGALDINRVERQQASRFHQAIRKDVKHTRNARRVEVPTR